MVQDSSSMILSMNVAAEPSDSNDNNGCTIRATKKRARVLHDDHQTFKGVVPQNNGHWGAQIYASHQRIWLGTFKSEIEAAMAYDSAAIKLRNGDSHRNFPWSVSNTQESIFQNNYSPEDVLNMIRDGTYMPKLADFLRTQSRIEKPINQQTSFFHGTDSQFSRVQLFQKELTPSDVGKLNRLVIPKRFAVKYFPYTSDDLDDHDDFELVFYDRNMRPWKFRYCYWKSSQSFVFTRGWNRFVKGNKLKEKDVVTFYTCDCPSHRGEERKKLLLIDVVCGYNNGDQSCVVDGTSMFDEMQVGLKLKLRQSRGDDEKDLEAEKALMRLGSSSSTHNVEEKGFRLFGVPINA